MKKLFIIVLTVLAAASVFTWLRLPSQDHEHTVLSWSSDANPQRYEQLEVFDRWLKDHHPEVKARPNGNPAFNVSLYAASNQSKLIQAVSGVAGDLIDGIPIAEYARMGLLVDVTDDARKRGFGMNSTYPGVVGLISTNGRQYGYPCNVNIVSLWINHTTFEQLDLPIPEGDWTPEEFEKLGKLFNEKVNRGQKVRTRFLCPPLGFNFVNIYARSLGADTFNETFTRSTLTDPRFAAGARLIYKWTYVDRILPSAAEVASNDVDTSGYGGAALAHFIHGNYAMIPTARYSLIRMRELPENERFEISNVKYPQYDFSNMLISARCTAVYAGSRHRDEAALFIEYLASKEYNDTIIYGADGLPPTPKYAIGNPDFLRPPGYSNEGDVHRNELTWALEIALPLSESPFFRGTGRDWPGYAFSKLMADRAEADEAFREAAGRINKSIDETVAGNARLRAMYEEAWERQKKIDAIKATWRYDEDDPYEVIDGEKIPPELIDNPYYLRYYKSIDMLEGDS